MAAFSAACRSNEIWGCFSIMELNPRGNPYNTGIIIDDHGAAPLYYRKLHPWIPVEPWEPGDLGIPVCDGPNGSQASASSSATTACFPRWRASAPTRARRS